MSHADVKANQDYRQEGTWKETMFEFSLISHWCPIDLTWLSIQKDLPTHTHRHTYHVYHNVRYMKHDDTLGHLRTPCKTSCRFFYNPRSEAVNPLPREGRELLYDLYKTWGSPRRTEDLQNLAKCASGWEKTNFSSQRSKRFKTSIKRQVGPETFVSSLSMLCSSSDAK